MHCNPSSVAQRIQNNKTAHFSRDIGYFRFQLLIIFHLEKMGCAVFLQIMQINNKSRLSFHKFKLLSATSLT